MTGLRSVVGIAAVTELEATGELGLAVVVVVVVVRIDVEVLSVVGFLVGLGRLGLRVGRLFPTVSLVTLAVVVRLGRGVVILIPGLLEGLREGRGRLVVVVVVDGAGACFFLFLFVFFPPVDPNRSPNISSPRRLKPV